MLRMMVRIRDNRSLHCRVPNQVPGNGTKQMWRYVEMFFKHNHMAPTTIIFEDGGKQRNIKANRKNFGTACNKATLITIINTRNNTENKRSIEINKCDCETQYVCKCGE